jgi:hypothetical protein
MQHKPKENSFPMQKCIHIQHPIITIHYMQPSSAPPIIPLPLLLRTTLALPALALLPLWRRVQEAFWNIIPVHRSLLRRRTLLRPLRVFAIRSLLIARDFVFVVLVLRNVIILVKLPPIHILQLYISIRIHPMLATQNLIRLTRTTSAFHRGLHHASRSSQVSGRFAVP